MVMRNLLYENDSQTLMWAVISQLLYDTCRVQRIGKTNLKLINNDFVLRLFMITANIDHGSMEAKSAVQLLVALNEQYMITEVAESTPVNSESMEEDDMWSVSSSNCDQNLVFEALRSYCSECHSFGEHLVFIINRERETNLQMLILKLLYLIFKHPETCDLFYTNDLAVLVDVFIRELYDLPSESVEVRQTYLRVLYPMLKHSQLNNPPHYKRDQLLRVLLCVNGSFSPLKFFKVDDLTKSLVFKCLSVDWLEHSSPITPTTMKDFKSPVNQHPYLAIDSRERSMSDVSVNSLMQVAEVRKPLPGIVLSTKSTRKKPAPPPHRSKHKSHVKSSPDGSDDNN